MPNDNSPARSSLWARLTEEPKHPPRSRDRWLVMLAWCVAMLGLAAPPIVIHLTPGSEGRNKDYDIWYDTGRVILEGGQIYPQVPNTPFPFMYPPSAAWMLAGLTMWGKLPFIILLELLNSAAWVTSLCAGIYIVRGRITVPALVWLLPFCGTLAYVADMYLLGQSNLLLLACLLGAFACLRAQRPVWCGALLAAAAAIKAFPIMALGYTVWRREWKATGWALVWLAGMTLVLPTCFQGWSGCRHDWGDWAGGMLFKYDKDTIAQRPDVTYRWKNQSIVGTAHRLLRPVAADLVPVAVAPGLRLDRPVLANLADLSFDTVNRLIVAGALSLCLIYVACMAANPNRTPETTSLEVAMLLILMTIFSPISWFYYGVWLMFPYTVIADRLARGGLSVREQTAAIAVFCVCLLLLNFVPPWKFYRPIRALGTPFFGYVLLFLELGWLLWREGRARPVAPASSDMVPPLGPASHLRAA